jgi:cytochrome b
MIWDLPTRLFHWLLVAAVGYAWFAVDVLEDMEQHFYAGYSALTLILFRIIWGVIGSYHSRFANFPLSISRIKTYSKSLFSSNADIQPRNYLGHNPLGALSSIAIIGIILLQTLSGLFANDGYYVYGPLAESISSKLSALITEVHEINFNIIATLIALHIIEIVYYQWVKKQKLIAAMIHGKKTIAAKDITQDTDLINAKKPASNILALFILLLIAAAIYFLFIG